MSDVVPSCQHPPLTTAKGGTTVAQLAHRFNLEIRPAPGQSSEQFAQRLIHAVAPLHRAGPGELSFLAHSRHRASLEQSQASAIVVNAETARDWQGPALISQQPSADFARIAALFEQLPDYAIGIHPTAVVHASAHLGAECRIAAGVVIGASAVIGNGCTIGPGCVIEDEARIGANTRLVARVSIAHHVELGARCLIHPGVVIGADGFGQAWEQDHWVKVPQLGRVIVGDDVEIGANTTIDRGALDDTIIGNGVRIDNLVQIAHNVRIGDHTAIAACVGIAGSAVIGRYCLIGGAAAILGHIQICDRVVVQGMSSITHSIDTPGEYGSAVAAQEAKIWRRNLARLRSLDKTLRELIQNQRRNQR